MSKELPTISLHVGTRTCCDAVVITIFVVCIRGGKKMAIRWISLTQSENNLQTPKGAKKVSSPSKHEIDLHFACETLKSLRAVLRALFVFKTDSEAFINFSARTKSGLSDAGLDAIHWIAVEKMLNFDLAGSDLRGMREPIILCDFCVAVFGFARAPFCPLAADIDCGISFRIISSFNSSGIDINFNFKTFRFRTLFTTKVPSCMNCSKSSFSNAVISCEMAKYWLNAERFRKSHSLLLLSSSN